MGQRERTVCAISPSRTEIFIPLKGRRRPGVNFRANNFRWAERVDRPFAVVARPTTFAWELIGVQQSQRIGPGRNSSAYCFTYGSYQSLRQSARGSWKSQNVRARVRTSR